LLRIGEGRQKVEVELGEDVIQLPHEMVLKGDKLDDLITSVYGHEHERFLDMDFMRGRAILTTTNKDVDEINTIVMDRLLGEVRIFNQTTKKLCAIVYF
jgi:hypothetical protein